jgi:hypothetical protein
MDSEDLFNALKAAGLPVVSCNSNRAVWLAEEATVEQRAQAKQIAEAFNFDREKPVDPRAQSLKQILRDDVPDAWRTSTTQERRVLWALKWALIETQRDFAN